MGFGQAVRNRIIFIPTWRCQLNCSYCDYSTKCKEGEKGYKVQAFGNEFFIKEEMHWAYWLALLARFKPYHIEFTGGEPTMWEGIVEFISHLPDDSSWAMTSNTLIEKACQLITPSKTLCWTASYHFHHKDQFRDNLKLLRLRGFPLAVTMVATPKNEEKVLEMMDEFEDGNIAVNIHPMITKGFEWGADKVIIDRLRKRAMQSNNENMRVVDLIRKTWQPDGAYGECVAGCNYFTLFPDGQVYRCYADALTERRQMSTIWNVELNKEALPCDGGCIFPCDIEVREGRVA